MTLGEHSLLQSFKKYNNEARKNTFWSIGESVLEHIKTHTRANTFTQVCGLVAAVVARHFFLPPCPSIDKVRYTDYLR